MFVADRDASGLQSLASQHNKNAETAVYTNEVDVADWDSQRLAFEKAIEVFDGRIDYVLPIAGIGERRSFPRRKEFKGFEKPDLSVIEVDQIGVIYTISLAVQHFRQTERRVSGWRGKSRLPCERYLLFGKLMVGI